MNNYVYLALVPILLRIAYSLWKRNIKITFQDKLIWITGASSGIGEELAYQLSRLGASLILSSRRESELNRVKQACQNPDKVHILPLDLEKPQEVLQKASQFIQQKELKVDILINNGGISMRASFMENAFENEITMVNVNYLSQVALTKAVVPGMLQRKSGQIVFMNSLQGKLGLAFRTSYSASKHALTGFADALRAEVEEHGVSITSLHPGYVNTNLSKNALSGQAGQLHGKTDASTSKGLSANAFVMKALRAIYLKEKETIIADSFKNGAAVPLRNIVPNLIFHLVEKKKKKELREAAKQKAE